MQSIYENLSFYISYLYNIIIYSYILYCQYSLYNIMQIRGLISMVYRISCLHLIKTRSDAIPFQDFTNWKALRTNIILFDAGILDIEYSRTIGIVHKRVWKKDLTDHRESVQIFLIAFEIFLCTAVQDAQTKVLMFLWPSSIELILEPNAFVVGKWLKWKITEKIPHTVCKI